MGAPAQITSIHMDLHGKTRRPLLEMCALALAAGLPAQQQGQQAKGAPDAFARYRECIQRLPFTFHTEGRELVAQTRTLQALKLLCGDYADAKQYQEHTRYTIAALLGKHFDKREFAPALTSLRLLHQKPVDTWLWFHALTIESRHAGTDPALALAKQNKNQLQRAAAILALGEISPSGLAQAIVAVCADFPKKDREGDRNLLLGALSGAILANKNKANDEAFRTGLTAYIKLLGDDVGLSHTAKLQIARHLMATLNGPCLFVNPEPWLELLARGSVKIPEGGKTVSQPKFFGIESDGERLCYVLDMSDSMCKEIAPSVRPSGPITGPRKKPIGALPDESDLPWAKIKTRWDLAREQLKISLQRLAPEKHFAVVWFGSDSGTLESTPGMVKATKLNVARVCEELDGIVCGKPVPQKAPDGVLRGSTNLHSGLRRAFGLSNKGYVESCAYVDAATLTHGCDTIFLLSDGEPSWDDFHCKDKDYGEGNAIHDAEYGKAAVRTPEMIYWGPYSRPDWLVQDVERMNAFRRIKIHCIGIGEASTKLLHQLAEVGQGQVYTIGKEQPGGR